MSREKIAQFLARRRDQQADDALLATATQVLLVGETTSVVLIRETPDDEWRAWTPDEIDAARRYADAASAALGVITDGENS